MGLCNYLIENQAPSWSPDKELGFMLATIMVIALIFGVVMIVFMFTLDTTIQIIRLYYRFIEGEGKYGAHQQLVLRRLGVDGIHCLPNQS